MRSLERDGVRLAYAEGGLGEPPLLLVHGWVCDHSYFAPQIEYFSRRRRVVAVDLRGHGQSDKPEQGYSMGALAEDLGWLCDALGVDRPVVVGHSMGGVLALELAHRRPGLPSAIVTLDAPIMMPPRLLEHLRSQRERIGGPNSSRALRAFIENMFLPTDNADRRASIVEHMTSAPEHVVTSLWEEMLACPSASAERAGQVPVPLLAVASAGGHMADLARLRELRQDVWLGQTVGAGHFHQLEVPDQVNAMIERFIGLVAPRLDAPS